ncbi:isoaspartyl peptidase/L-asparaginase [Microcoleus sp. LEGE 07076]|uniref:isoaspartyl peptidase/L-asparaginase n=1 Tax=Microcoleus sp. LEGE 07076 TaxID=915322 RepID=UPI0018821EC4|nr:isoaspartyl peptidase/L-asparaginase [Microcoleus sp. LEGE 07076]MBE9187084.1 isoaspartyl peptidase/L-asparaginase [Microcoleus sp. LEGE 07076]
MASQQVQPKLVIHGGAGSSLHSKGGIEAVRKSLYNVLEEVYPLLKDGESAVDAVIHGCRLLEDDPRFNSGTGSVVQSDGQIRMSASLMDGLAQRFSGAINVSRVQNPIELAKFLQTSDDRVLSDFGATELLRELHLPIYDPMTDLRLREWMQERQGNFSKAMADVVAEPAGTGTIGVVALDAQGRLAAGTSTGGKGFERIGRVSDSAMPAGNYATVNAAVSCTGIGEHIMDECLAARIVIRVTDGLSLKAAFERSFAEADSRQRDFGAIGIDASGAIAIGKTSEVILGAFHNGTEMGDTLETNKGTLIFIA